MRRNISLGNYGYMIYNIQYLPSPLLLNQPDTNFGLYAIQIGKSHPVQLGQML